MRSIRDLKRNEDGTFLVFFALALAALLGMVALSFDLGRVASTQSELQSFADSVALAAAAELDGTPTAIARAQRAAEELITDRQTFGQAEDAAVTEDVQALDLGDFTLTFLSALPATDSALDPEANIVCEGSDCDSASAAQDAAAILVRVDVDEHALSMGFASTLSVLTGGGEREAAVAASATAGFTQYACDVTPLMFCIPSDESFTAEEKKGTMVLIRSGGNNTAWGPGDFGFLQPSTVAPTGVCAGLTGRPLDSCLTGGVSNVSQCFMTRGVVDLEPGQRNGIENAAFNVRFDIYLSTMNSARNDAHYAPAPNVIKGIVPRGGGQCIGQNAITSPNTVALPRDACFAAGNCSHNNRVGDGDWQAGLTAYEQRNYGATGLFGGGPWETRYDYYVAEHEARLAANGTLNPILTARAETGRPQCSTATFDDPADRPGPERRVIIAAGIDCVGNNIQGARRGVPVEEYFRIFLTEPIGLDPLTNLPNIWGEIIGSAGGAGSGGEPEGGIFRDVVQLYR